MKQKYEQIQEGWRVYKNKEDAEEFKKSNPYCTIYETMSQEWGALY